MVVILAIVATTLAIVAVILSLISHILKSILKSVLLLLQQLNLFIVTKFVVVSLIYIKGSMLPLIAAAEYVANTIMKILSFCPLVNEGGGPLHVV